MLTQESIKCILVLMRCNNCENNDIMYPKYIEDNE